MARVDHRIGDRQDQGADQRDVDRPDERYQPAPRRGAEQRAARARPHLRQDPIAA